MPLMYCPECKEIILEGELKGSNPSCHACAVRTDTSDLIPMGQSSRPQTALKEPAGDEFGSYSNASQNPMMVMDADQSANGIPSGNGFPNIPVIHHWNELAIVPGWKLDRYNPSTGQATLLRMPKKTSSSTKKLAIIVALVGFLLCALLVIMMIMLDVDFQTTLLIIILIAMLFLPIPFVLKLASNTTWIDIDKEYISIETGKDGKRSGNSYMFKRDPRLTEIYQDWTTEYKHSGHDVSNIDFNRRLVCIRDSQKFYQIGYYTGDAFEIMLKTILIADIQD